MIPRFASKKIDPKLEAALLAAALVSAADGQIRLGHQVAVDRMLQEMPEHAGPDVHGLIEFYRQHTARCMRSAAQRRAALEHISTHGTDPWCRHRVLNLVTTLAEAQSPVPEPVRQTVLEIAKVLDAEVPGLTGGARPGLLRATPEQRVVVVANDKGGTGKSTIAIHLAVAAQTLGLQVGVLDCDSRQGTISRYLRRRDRMQACQAQHPHALAFAPLDPDVGRDGASRTLQSAIAGMADAHVVVIDTPGYDVPLARAATAGADIVLTPLNDSLIDVDALADVDPERRLVVAPSPFAQAMMQANVAREEHGLGVIDWVVLRNRVAQLDSITSRDVDGLLQTLSPRMGFRLCSGLSERVIFRQLFLDGLTVFDLPGDDKLSESHRRSRMEIMEILGNLDLVTGERRWV